MQSTSKHEQQSDKTSRKNGTRPFKQRQWNRVQNLGGWAQSLKGQVGHVACIWRVKPKKSPQNILSFWQTKLCTTHSNVCQQIRNFSLHIFPRIKWLSLHYKNRSGYFSLRNRGHSDLWKGIVLIFFTRLGYGAAHAPFWVIFCCSAVHVINTKYLCLILCNAVTQMSNFTTAFHW